MPNATWKAFERRLARLLGTERIPVTGERAGADFETPLFAFQAKKRATVPGYLAEWLDGIRAARPDKVGIVIMQLPRRPDCDAWSCSRSRTGSTCTDRRPQTAPGPHESRPPPLPRLSLDPPALDGARRRHVPGPDLYRGTGARGDVWPPASPCTSLLHQL